MEIWLPQHRDASSSGCHTARFPCEEQDREDASHKATESRTGIISALSHRDERECIKNSRVLRILCRGACWS